MVHDSNQTHLYCHFIPVEIASVICASMNFKHHIQASLHSNESYARNIDSGTQNDLPHAIYEWGCSWFHEVGRQGVSNAFHGVISGHSKGLQGLFMVFQRVLGALLDISGSFIRRYQGRFMEIERIAGASQRVSEVLKRFKGFEGISGAFQGASGVSQGRSMGFPKHFLVIQLVSKGSRNVPEVITGFLERSKGVSRGFKGFQGVSRCFKELRGRYNGIPWDVPGA